MVGRGWMVVMSLGQRGEVVNLRNMKGARYYKKRKNWWAGRVHKVIIIFANK